MTLPASLIVDVTVQAQDRFPSVTTFGTPIFLTTTSQAGEVDASNRTKSYASIAEVAADWATTDDFYKAAVDAFSQNPHPDSIKAGFVDSTVAVDAAGMQTELDAIYDADPDWFWVCVDSGLRDSDQAQGLIEWIETQEKLAIICSNDALLKDASDDTNIAAVNKGSYINTAVIYSSTAGEFPDMALASKMAANDLDDSDSHYTAAFKRLRSISTENITTDEFRAITGLVPGTGADTTTGHCANVQIDIGDLPQVQTGTMLTPNTFIDEMHFRYWLTARARERMLAVFTNNKVVPYDVVGVAMLTNAIEEIMAAATISGHVAREYSEDEGDLIAPYAISVPNIADIPASQRQARVFPNIDVTFRYAGAVHHVTVTFTYSY